MAKRALRASGRAACEFELSADILTNRIMRTSLRRLLARQIGHQCDVPAEMRATYRRLDGEVQERMRMSTFVRLQSGGNRRLYQFFLAVSTLAAESSLEGFRIQARTVELSRQWRDIHSEMREVIAV